MTDNSSSLLLPPHFLCFLRFFFFFGGGSNSFSNLQFPLTLNLGLTGKTLWRLVSECSTMKIIQVNGEIIWPQTTISLNPVFCLFLSHPWPPHPSLHPLLFPRLSLKVAPMPALTWESKTFKNQSIAREAGRVHPRTPCEFWTWFFPWREVLVTSVNKVCFLMASFNKTNLILLIP